VIGESGVNLEDSKLGESVGAGDTRALLVGACLSAPRIFTLSYLVSGSNCKQVSLPLQKVATLHYAALLGRKPGQAEGPAR